MATLRSDLHSLIVRHSLPETLDRLLTMAEEQQRLSTESQSRHWNDLIHHLDKATQAAISLAQPKEARGEDLWK
jgi:hypothetical protein